MGSFSKASLAWSRMLSLTERARKMPRPSGTWQTPSWESRWGGQPVASTPSTSTRPDDGLSSPDATRSSVVFPAPLGPSSATTALSGTTRFTSRNTVCEPYPAVIPRSSSIYTSTSAASEPR